MDIVLKRILKWQRAKSHAFCYYSTEFPYQTPSLYQYWASLNPGLISLSITGQVLKQVLQVCQVLAKTWVTLAS